MPELMAWGDASVQGGEGEGKELLAALLLIMVKQPAGALLDHR